MPRIRFNEGSTRVTRFNEDSDGYDVDNNNTQWGKRGGESRRRQRTDAPEQRERGRKPRMADGRESFKCGHCKAFIGPTVSGGRHRNHCPLCLYSRHVDDRQPGDRACTCRSLMQPVGTFHRPKGEQVLLHRCLGCGVERYNRVAADDNLLACLRLPLVAPRTSANREDESGDLFDDEVAIA